VLDGAALRFAEERRSATLATIAADGTPRPVPICFVLEQSADDGWALYTPLDEKPKASQDPLALARVRDIRERPEVTLLFDRWDEDWAGLGWVRARGRAALLGPAGRDGAEHERVVVALRAKYPQYRAQAIDTRPLIKVGLTRVTSWGRLSRP
jgi:PPOX class probable F420-dependent enzyme